MYEAPTLISMLMLTEIFPLVWFEVFLAQWRKCVVCVCVCVCVGGDQDCPQLSLLTTGCDSPRDQG